jgi:hypothetical protein
MDRVRGPSETPQAKLRDSVSLDTSRPALVETPNTAGEIMTKDVVSFLAGSSVRDVAILLLEKRIKANSPKTSILISSPGP